MLKIRDIDQFIIVFDLSLGANNYYLNQNSVDQVRPPIGDDRFLAYFVIHECRRWIEYETLKVRMDEECQHMRLVGETREGEKEGGRGGGGAGGGRGEGCQQEEEMEALLDEVVDEEEEKEEEEEWGI